MFGSQFQVGTSQGPELQAPGTWYLWPGSREQGALELSSLSPCHFVQILAQEVVLFRLTLVPPTAVDENPSQICPQAGLVRPTPSQTHFPGDSRF